MSFTVVFTGDIREWPRNPFDEITVFGCPYAIGIGDLIEQRDELLAALERMVNDSMFKDHPEASQMAIDAIAKATGAFPEPTASGD